MMRSTSYRRKRADAELGVHTERHSNTLERWRHDVGIDERKWLTPCCADEFGCQCQAADAKEATERLALRDAELLNSMTHNPVTHVSMPECIADAYMTLVLTAVPRARVVYVHLTDDGPCIDDHCARVHSLQFRLRPVSEAFPPTPRYAGGGSDSLSSSVGSIDAPQTTSQQ
jgi:hypothetical protein